MKQNLLKTWLMLCLFILLGGGNSAWAEEATIIFSSGTNSGTNYYFQANNGTINRVLSFASAKNSSTNEPAYNSNSSELRLYGHKNNAANGGSITLTAVEGVTFTSFELQVTSSTTSAYTAGSNSPVTLSYTNSIASVSGLSCSTLTFQNKNTSTTQFKIKSIKVTYTTGSGGGSTATPLSVPTNLSSSNVTSTGATLTWDAVANASSYKVKIGSTEYDANTNSYSATGLTASTQYTWSVKAIGDGTNYSSSNYAANANFTTAAPASHKAYFYVNGALQNAGGTDVTEGASITFPADPADIEGKKFQGWTQTQNYSSATTAPSDMTKSATMGTDDVTYYAVFATVTGEGPEVVNYVKLTSNSFDSSKKYVIGAKHNNTTTAYFTSYSTVDANASWGIMSTNTSENTPLVFTLSGTANELVAKDNKGNYLNGTVNDFRMQSTSVTNILNADGTIHATQASNNADRNLRYNTSYGLRWYSTTTGNSAYFYEIQVSGGFEYSNYTTTLATQYDVTLNVNGGTINSGNITKYAEGTGATLPTDVTKTGYDFGGWYDNEDCTGDAVTTIGTDATGAKEYWAKWTAHHHNVVFHKNDGASPEATTTQDYAYNETKNLTANTWERSGYNFTGWTTTAEGTVEYADAASFTLTTDADVPLYAVWVHEDAKAFTTNGTENMTITDQPASVDPHATSLTLNYTVATGYELTGVTVTVGETTLTESEISYNQTTLTITPATGNFEAGDVVVTFTTEEIKWTVNFDYGTGSCSTASLTEESYQAGITLPAAGDITTPAGTTFYGWTATKVITATATAPTLVTLSEGKYMPTEDGETLFAVYTKEEAMDAESTSLSASTNDQKLNADHPVTYKMSAANSYTNPLRIYKNNVITIAGATITQIVFDVASDYDASNLIVNTGTSGSITNGVWTKAADSEGATSVAIKAGDQVRVDKITATYVTTQYSSVFNPKATLSFDSENYTATLGKAFAAPTLNNPNEVEVSYTSSNEDVAAFEEGVLTIKAAGTTKITANFTGNASYEANKASYTLTVNYGTIAQIKELTSNSDVKNFTINFEDAVVTYVSGNYAYLQDASAAVMVNFASHGLTAGKKINGIATGTIKAANQIDAIQSLDFSKATVTEGGVVPAAIEIALKDVDATYDGKLITVNGATVKNSMANTATSGASISDDDETTSFNLYAPNKGVAVNSTEVGNFTGFVSIYNGTSYRLNLYEQSQYVKTQSVAQDQEISFTTSTYTFDEDTEDITNFAGQAISGTVKGNVTYAKKEGDDIFTSINPETGAVVLNGTCGTATIEATAAATDETVEGVTQPYNETKKTYTITVRPRYTVSFKNMDDTQAAEDIRQESFGASITLPAAEDKEGYRFLGWTASKEATTADVGAAGATYTPTDVTILYALYAQLHTAKFMVNGEQLGETQNLIAGESVVFPDTKPADKNGLTFFCWTNNEIDGVAETQPTKVTEATMSNDNLVFHAVFVRKSDSSSTVDITMDATSTTKDGVTIACAIGNGTTAPTMSSSECRIYASNTITISASSTITAFSLTFHKQGSKAYISSMTASTGTYTSGGESTSGTDDKTDTWSGSAKSITLTAGSSGQRVLVGGTITVGSTTYSHFCTTLPTLTVETENGVTTVTGTVSSDEDVASVTTGLVAGTSLDMTDATVSDEVLSSISDAVAGQNVLIYAPATSESDAVNVVVNGTCENLVLTDKVAVNIPEEITATNITYERKTGKNVDVLEAGKYATVCLPYAFPIGEFKVMKFAGVEGGVVNFEYVTKTEPNVPYVIRPNKDEEASLSFNIVDGEVSVTTSPAAPVGEGLSVNDKDTDKMLAPRKAARNDATGFYGTYESLTLYGNYGYYGFASGVFKKANTDLGTFIRPFRAYLFIDSSNGARPASFSFSEGEETAINNVFNALDNNLPMYDLSGRRIQTPAKGQIVIVGGQKVMFK